ncbi:MAG: CvpA family protein [Rhodospirillales bacterium]|jgi:membrane protein required for colicin V production
MNPVDLGVLGAVLLCALIALVMGFVRTVLALLSWAGAAMVTIWGFAHARPIARDFISPPLLADIAAGLGVFVGALIVFSIVSQVLSSFVRGSPLSFLDRTLGFVLGAVLGAILVAVAWLGASSFMERDKLPDVLQTARTLPMVEQLADLVRGMLPAEFRGTARGAADEAARRGKQVELYRGALEAPANPTPRTAPPAGETGYKTDERRRLDNLFETRQGPAAGGPTR